MQPINIQEIINSIDWSLTMQYVIPTATFLVGYYLGRKTSVGVGLQSVAKSIRYYADKSAKSKAKGRDPVASNTLPFDE